MNFTEEFLNEFRKTIKDILLEGDLERLNLAKQFLGFDNKVFGDFLAPLLKEEQELVLHHSLLRNSTEPCSGILRRPQFFVSWGVSVCGVPR